MDALDRSQEIEEKILDMRIRALRNRGETPPGDRCRLCGAEIHPARLAALPGARTCIDCQAEIEGGGAAA